MVENEEETLNGVVVPCITPFQPSGNIDDKALEIYVNYLAQHVPCVSVCAIYGSGILMRVEQRKRVAEIALKTVANKAKISVFVGSTDTDRAVELAVHAQAIGAHAVSCVAPIYYRQVDEAIYLHYHELIKAVDIPVYAYDSPVYAGNKLSPNVLERLAKAGLGGIISGAATYGIEHLWSILRNSKLQKTDIWSIRDGIALPAMMMGAVGFESGVANFWPEIVMEFYGAIRSGEYEVASRLQEKILRLRDISHLLGKNIPTLHALIQMRGLEVGYPKRPFYLLSKEEVKNLKVQLRELDFQTPMNLS